jgi:hypothetical protein
VVEDAETRHLAAVNTDEEEAFAAPRKTSCGSRKAMAENAATLGIQELRMLCGDVNGLESRLTRVYTVHNNAQTLAQARLKVKGMWRRQTTFQSTG